MKDSKVNSPRLRHQISRPWLVSISTLDADVSSWINNVILRNPPAKSRGLNDQIRVSVFMRYIRVWIYIYGER